MRQLLKVSRRPLKARRQSDRRIVGRRRAHAWHSRHKRQITVFVIKGRQRQGCHIVQGKVIQGHKARLRLRRGAQGRHVGMEVGIRRHGGQGFGHARRQASGAGGSSAGAGNRGHHVIGLVLLEQRECLDVKLFFFLCERQNCGIEVSVLWDVR